MIQKYRWKQQLLYPIQVKSCGANQRFETRRRQEEEEVRSSTDNQLVAARVRMYVRATVVGCLSERSKPSRGVAETGDDESATQIHEISLLIAVPNARKHSSSVKEYAVGYETLDLGQTAHY
jgi:hypothetical protein